MRRWFFGRFFFATQKCPAYIIQSWKRSLRKHFLARIRFRIVKIEVHGRVLIDFWRCSKRTFWPNQAKFYSVSPIFRLFVDFLYLSRLEKGFLWHVLIEHSNRTSFFSKILVKFRLFEWFLTDFRPLYRPFQGYF